MSSFLDQNGLLYLWQKIVNKFVVKETGKGLSTNDYTSAEKEKLANVYTKTEIDGKGYLTSASVANKADKSTTLAGYGISDAYTKSEIDGKGYLTSASIVNKADKSTTLAGYGITNAYTKEEVDGKLGSVYKAAGAVLFENLPTPSSSNLGYVYSLLNEFTTDDRFIASVPTYYPIGTNVVVIEVEVEMEIQYKFDILSGFVDLSDYLKDTDLSSISNEEIDAIVTG